MSFDEIELIIFDCDGVLVDSELIANREGAKLKSELGYSITTEEHILKFTGFGHKSPEYKEVLARMPANYGEMSKLRRNKAFHAELKAIPGIKELLIKMDIQFCLASGGDLEKIHTTLGITGLTPFFDRKIFSGQMVDHGKPFPDLFLLAAETMKVKPKNCLVIEDSIPGVQAAVAAGMRVVGFLGGSHVYPQLGPALSNAGATALFSDMSDFRKILSQLGE